MISWKSLKSLQSILSCSSQVNHVVDNDCDIAIIGGGLCGLYCAYMLSKETNYNIHIFERLAYLGGRIVTKRHDNFLIEYGPAQFEPGTQTKLMKLVRDLNIDVTHFSSTTSTPTTYIKKAPNYSKLLPEEIEIFDLELLCNKKLPDPMILIMHCIKKILRPQFDVFRKYHDRNREKLQQFVRDVAKYEEKFIHDYEALELIKLVVSSACLEYIIQDGNFSYIVNKNTNASEFICLFIDLFAKFKWDFISINGGMHMIIDQLHNALNEKVTIHYSNELSQIEEIQNPLNHKLSFNTGICTICKHVILTCPPEKILTIQGIPRQISNTIKFNLKRVKLFKIFVIIENPPWAEGTMELMTDIPCREIQHFVDNNNEGKLVFYGEEPQRKLWLNSEPEYKLTDRETSILLRNKVSEILRASYPNHNTWKIKVIEMNDWYSKPKLGIYLWHPGVDSDMIINNVASFSLTSAHEKNVHICGETFSNYQCFMEGALQSAQNVVLQIQNNNNYKYHSERFSFETLYAGRVG